MGVYKETRQADIDNTRFAMEQIIKQTGIKVDSPEIENFVERVIALIAGLKTNESELQELVHHYPAKVAERDRQILELEKKQDSLLGLIQNQSERIEDLQGFVRNLQVGDS